MEPKSSRQNKGLARMCVLLPLRSSMFTFFFFFVSCACLCVACVCVCVQPAPFFLYLRVCARKCRVSFLQTTGNVHYVATSTGLVGTHATNARRRSPVANPSKRDGRVQGADSWNATRWSNIVVREPRMMTMNGTSLVVVKGVKRQRSNHRRQGKGTKEDDKRTMTTTTMKMTAAGMHGFPPPTMIIMAPAQKIMIKRNGDPRHLLLHVGNARLAQSAHRDLPRGVGDPGLGRVLDLGLQDAVTTTTAPAAAAARLRIVGMTTVTAETDRLPLLKYTRLAFQPQQPNVLSFRKGSFALTYPPRMQFCHFGWLRTLFFYDPLLNPNKERKRRNNIYFVMATSASIATREQRTNDFFSHSTSYGAVSSFFVF